LIWDHDFFLRFFINCGMQKIKTFLLMCLLITLVNTSCKKDELEDRSRVDISLTGKWLLVAYHNDDGSRSWWSKPTIEKNEPKPTLEFMADGTYIDPHNPWNKTYKLIAPGSFVVTSEVHGDIKYRYFETNKGELIIHAEICYDGYGCFVKYKRL